MLACLWQCAAARAQTDGDFGLGVIIGQPTGASLKYFLSQEIAIDAAVGFGLVDGDHFAVHADLLWHFQLKSWDVMSMALYLGPGPKLGFKKEHFNLGARGAVGVALSFNRAPFDIFLEAVAGLWLIEKLDLHMGAAIGGRFWF